MKCPKCNGKGKVLDYVAERNCHGEWETVLREIPCDKCQRKPMTNEEWLRSATTDELAEWFGNWHSFSCVFCKHWKNGCIYNHNQVRCAIEEGKSNKELWVKWLKQPHREG